MFTSFKNTDLFSIRFAWCGVITQIFSTLDLLGVVSEPVTTGGILYKADPNQDPDL